MNESRDGVTKFGQLEPLALPKSLPWSMKTMLSCDWNGDGDADIITQSAYPWFCWMDGSYIRNNGYYVMGTIIAVDENNM
jgi:hypothetical protein